MIFWHPELIIIPWKHVILTNFHFSFALGATVWLYVNFFNVAKFICQKRSKSFQILVGEQIFQENCMLPSKCTFYTLLLVTFVQPYVRPRWSKSIIFKRLCSIFSLPRPTYINITLFQRLSKNALILSDIALLNY